MAALDFIDRDLEELRGKGLLIRVREIGSAQGPWIVVDGKKVLNLCSNNYLGLANDERLRLAAEEAVRKWGVGPGAVRSIAGHLSLHAELERKLAHFKGAEATLSLQSGFCANLATIPALVGKGDLIFSDELNHASIIDGCRLSGARIVRFAHADASSLDEALTREKTDGKKLVIADGVFSMDGDVAPLPDYVDVAEKHDAIVMVDDAHGEGVLGKGGRGIVDHFDLHGRVHVEIGTLSKAFGVVGGFVAGSRKLIDYLRQRARPFLFSSAMTAADAAACVGAVDLLQESDERVTRLWDNARYFQSRLGDLGFDIGKTTTPITPVMIGDAGKAMEMSRKLFEEGVFAGALGYPTVPLGKARIRCMLSAGHSREDLDFALEAFQKVSAGANVEA